MGLSVGSGGDGLYSVPAEGLGEAQRDYLAARTRAPMATAAKKELEIAVRDGTLIEKVKVIRALEPLSVCYCAMQF